MTEAITSRQATALRAFPTFKFKMTNIEKIIIKDKTPITCDNENCSFKGDLWWCYNNNERQCGLYKEWERKMIKYSGKKK